jgi:hypothetical protein
MHEPVSGPTESVAVWDGSADRPALPASRPLNQATAVPSQPGAPARAAGL